MPRHANVQVQGLYPVPIADNVVSLDSYRKKPGKSIDDIRQLVSTWKLTAEHYQKHFDANQNWARSEVGVRILHTLQHSIIVLCENAKDAGYMPNQCMRLRDELLRLLPRTTAL